MVIFALLSTAMSSLRPVIYSNLKKLFVFKTLANMLIADQV